MPFLNPLFPSSYLNPLFLTAGLVAAAIPVLIHWFMRDRIRRVSFSTLQFFVKSSRTVLRRKRIREMILMMMRAAVCAILALAFARPLLPAAQPPDLSKAELTTACVVVVDTSASMIRAGQDAIRKQALSAVEDLRDDVDAAGLIVFSDHPVFDVKLTPKIDDVRRRINTIIPENGSTDISSALLSANNALKGLKAKSRVIVLVSDLQKSGWSGFRGDWKLSPGVELVVKEVKATGGKGNIAIVDAEYPRSIVADGIARPIAVKIANYTSTDRPDTPVMLNIGGKVVAETRVFLRANSTGTAVMRHTFSKPGDNPGIVQVAADDDDPIDNSFYYNTRVLPRIKVLVLNGAPSDKPVEDSAFFIEQCLVPEEPSAPAKTEGLFKYIDDTPFLMRTVQAYKAVPDDFKDVKVVIAANVGSLTPEVRKALTTFVGNGGGLLLLPGDKVTPSIFNDTFVEVAPCKLNEAITAPADRPAFLSKIEYDHAIFAEFAGPHRGDLSRVKLFKYWDVKDSLLARSKPARLSDERPALIEREIGGGLSILFICPIDPKWTNFPIEAGGLLVSFVHQTVNYLSARGEPQTKLAVGAKLEGPSGVKVTDPKNVTYDPPVVMMNVGHYTYVSADGKSQVVYSANRDAAEADPVSLDAKDMLAQIKPTAEETARAQKLELANSDERKDDKGYWWFVLAALAVFSVGELLLGNTTARH